MDHTTGMPPGPPDGLSLAIRSSPDVSSARARWLPVATAVVALVILYGPVIAEMAVEWVTFPSLSHGFAVPLVSAYLIWRRRQSISAVPVASTPAGLIVFTVALGLLIAGTLTGESLVARLSLPLALLGIALYLTGPGVTRIVWPAIAYLVCMIPFPHLPLRAVALHSRLFEAAATARTLQWLGVPVIQHGVMLRLPSMTLEVADECSAIRAIPVLVALGVAYACLQLSIPAPTYDRMVAEYLLIRNAEDIYWKTANIFSRSGNEFGIATLFLIAFDIALFVNLLLEVLTVH